MLTDIILRSAVVTAWFVAGILIGRRMERRRWRRLPYRYKLTFDKCKVTLDGRPSDLLRKVAITAYYDGQTGGDDGGSSTIGLAPHTPEAPRDLPQSVIARPPTAEEIRRLWPHAHHDSRVDDGDPS